MGKVEDFLFIHSDLPREGPGDRASLDWALGHLALRPDARILDAGCGPGADIAGLLSHVPRARLLAMETHAAYAARVREAFAQDPRVRVCEGDMARPQGVFDLIWCAGALYFLGVEAGLRGWRDHLAPGGAAVFTDLAWTGAPRSPEAEAFWAAYPAMGARGDVLAATLAAGYRVVADRFLPASAWTAYYGPLEARIQTLRAGGAPSAELRLALDAEQGEIDLWRAHGGEFGYLQVVAVVQ
ncbi:MAG: methyltransferase domain-containing protein [Rhodobacteraceae bacterium]|nr:methyltransferase domain-containing protein [Paracoccaceae bacterium]